MPYSFDFTINSGDKNKGTVYLPNQNSTNQPTIVYCHGWKGDRQLEPSAKVLCEQAMLHNIAFVTFDFFGCGETGGDYRNMTYKRWQNNLSDIIDWIQHQTWANPNKIGCFAISSGSTAALRLAQEDSCIQFIISVATCISTHIGMDVGGPGKQLVDYLEDLVAGKSAKLFGIDFGLDFYLDAVGNAPIHKMQEIKCPVYFLQGAADNIFRRTDARIGHEIMSKNNLPSHYYEISGGNHSLNNVPDECAFEVIKWLKGIEFFT